MLQPDKETEQKIWEHNELAEMVKGDGWKIARKKLIEQIILLSDIMELSDSDPTKLSLKLAVNQEAIKILLGWLRTIEGEAKDTSIGEMLKKEKTESYMMILEN